MASVTLTAQVKVTTMHNSLDMAEFCLLMDVLTNEATDFKQLVGAIAKIDPQVVVVAAKELDGEVDYSSPDHALAVVRAYARAGNVGEKIKMIKELRHQTGMGLADAKNAIEEAMAKFGV